MKKLNVSQMENLQGRCGKYSCGHAIVMGVM